MGHMIPADSAREKLSVLLAYMRAKLKGDTEGMTKYAESFPHLLDIQSDNNDPYLSKLAQ